MFRLLALGALIGFLLVSCSDETVSPADESAQKLLSERLNSSACRLFEGGQGCFYIRRIEDWFTTGTLQAEQVPGAVSLVDTGCLNCHVYRDLGTRNLAAPELTHVGRRRDSMTLRRVILNPGEAMPAFDSLPERIIEELVRFLVESR